MTYLELVAAVGSVPMDISLYVHLTGRLTEREMKKCDRLEKGRIWWNVFICKIEMMK